LQHFRVIIHKAIQGRPPDTEGFGGLGFVATGSFKGGLNDIYIQLP
jgi:hypothetical protein